VLRLLAEQGTVADSHRPWFITDDPRRATAR
jgi:hypothetical protein